MRRLDEVLGQVRLLLLLLLLPPPKSTAVTSVS
jgi:hypothetical protein